MSSYSVAFHGITRSAEAAARSMLRLLLPMLGNHWTFADATASDVVILEARALEELNRAGSARASALYIVFADSGPPPPNTFCVIQRPMNSARTIEVLHKAQAELERRTSGAPTTVLTSGSVGDEPALAERAIRTSIRTAIRWTVQDPSRAVTLMKENDTKILSALPDRGFTSRLSAAELADLIRRNEPVKLLNLTEEERGALLARKRNFDPLVKLEWIFWLTGSNGDLRPELHVSKPYRLRKWPDFARLPHYRADVRMASLLKAEALTVGQLAERAGVRLETACNFVNACAALNFLASPRPVGENVDPGANASKPAANERAKKPDAPPPGVLGSLRSALGIGPLHKEPAKSS